MKPLQELLYKIIEYSDEEPLMFESLHDGALVIYPRRNLRFEVSVDDDWKEITSIIDRFIRDEKIIECPICEGDGWEDLIKCDNCESLMCEDCYSRDVRNGEGIFKCSSCLMFEYTPPSNPTFGLFYDEDESVDGDEDELYEAMIKGMGQLRIND